MSKFDLAMNKAKAVAIHKLWDLEDKVKKVFPNHTITVDEYPLCRIIIHGRGLKMPVLDELCLDKNFVDKVHVYLGKGEREDQKVTYIGKHD